MTSYRGFRFSHLAIKLCTAALALVMVGAATMASADPSDATGSRSFLALGDSVVFGYITKAGFEYINPNNFVGYPEYVGPELGLHATNSACPGETTSGFISSTGADNGCRPFRANFPLHVAYTSTQLAFARNFLASHPHTRLVTIGLGANDIFLLQDVCAGVITCIQAHLPAVLTTIGSNLNFILGSLRATGFRGVLMVVNYYSLDYTDPQETGIIAALNDTLATIAGANGAVVADAFTTFNKAASTSFAGGKTCRAGLLNASPQNQFLCDVHPSQSGQQLLSDTVEAAYRAADPAHGDD